MNLKNKKILITAGPTWVPIDSVRVISNIATGQTGILLAEKLQDLGAKVTLLLGPAQDCCLDNNLRLIRFRYFDELRNIIIKELKSKKFDIVIHSAAVVDFKPQYTAKGKINSNSAVNLRLRPLPKIAYDIRRLAPKVKLAMFKLESNVSDDTLIARARVAQKKIAADFVVANMIHPYRAYVIDKLGKTIFVKSKNELVKKLIKLLVMSY